MDSVHNYPYSNVIHRCFRCGYCKFPVNWLDVNNCPAYARFRVESYSCGGRLWLIRAWIEDRLELTDHLAEVVYACTLCKNCELKCPFSFNTSIVDMIVSARREMVEIGRIPEGTKEFLNHIYKYKNPYGIKKSRRGEWAKDLGIDYFNNHEYLFYVGCTGSFDSRAQEAARSVAKVFLKAGLSFGILGEEEVCDGNEVKSLGEDGLFDFLVEENLRLFNKKGVKKVISLSPHGYNAFKNYYPAYGGKFEVYHYIHILDSLIKKKILNPKKKLNLRVCFHDPCFLGRWNNEYHAPRRVLKTILKIEPVEMERSKESALCCGGGGGNFYMDLLGGSEDSPARIRVREALKLDVEVIAVCCPKCLIMLEDAVKSEGVEEKITIMDIGEMVENCI